MNCLLFMSLTRAKRNACDESVGHLTRSETKAGFAEVGAVLGCVHCKRSEDIGKQIQKLGIPNSRLLLVG